jgi:hypothetical protein
MIPRPRTVQFQISIRARHPRGATFTNEFMRQVTERWIETGEQPHGFTVRVVIWSAGKQREISEIDSSERGEILRATLRGALQERRLVIKKVGHTK